MPGELSKLDPSITKPPSWFDTVRRQTVAIRNRWRTLRPLMHRAVARIRSAQGTGEKLKELRSLALKARARLLRRAVIASAQQHTIADAKISSYIVAPVSIPECRPLGGGMLAITIAGPALTQPRIAVRDRFGNMHSATQVDRIERQFAHGPAAPADSIAPDQASPASLLEAVQFIVQVPSELFANMTSEVDVHVQGLSDPLIFSGVTLENSIGTVVSRISVEHNLIVFSGTADDTSANEMNLGLFLDGKMSASTVIRSRGRNFSGAILIDPSHLDGAIHHVELRDLRQMDLLASTYELFPLHVTPWEALQAYARAPLDGTLSPTARHHFRSQQLWLEKISQGRTDIPPIAHLYAEILHGFRKRREYPALQFPMHDHPVASIIIPVHNKFEVTYLCLCSLLFAYNDTPFEVILVDDGSSDETLDIAQVISGIRILRHESARGFVDSCNDGASLATGEFVVFLNNDVEATARWLDELIETYRSFDNIGLLGSKLIYPDGRLQEAGGIVWGSGNPWNVGRDGNAFDPRYNYLRQVDYVSGAAMMLPRGIWTDVGGFSQEFAPGYFEDTDLAMKVREAGHLVVYVPTSTIIHFEGKSSGTDTASGMKRFQEVNRPKFVQKWAHAFTGHGVEGKWPDREKDRAAAFHVLFLDHQFPNVDGDAGSYGAFQEIRLLQSLGAKVTFLPRNLAWMDRHTQALQRIGVECLYSPFVTNYSEYLLTHAREFDVVFVCRYQIAQQVVPIVRSASPSTKIIFNLADLHFLREIREVAARAEGYTRQRPEITRAAELAVVQSCDLTFSYTDVELAVLESHLKQPTALARLPWIVEPNPLPRTFADTKDILFLGGFSHPPNTQAVRFFADEVMPGLREHLPEVHFDVVGKGSDEALAGSPTDMIRVLGYVSDLDEVMGRARVFVAPLLAGAGLKGKVVEAISRGVPCVLSPIAAEGTGLVDGISCLIADTAPRWIECVLKLYTDEALWAEMSRNALKLAETKYAFRMGLDEFERALQKIGIKGRRNGALAYRHTRPLRYGI
jgi:GT2 family glycosyltransferase/glycosyltransferase involved in cell wall biosynthesis